ncbi:MAG: alpha/beta hydrolase [Syntrophaceae bacterium]|nr:alpha/beta hydrolase [Syntrophaceae bacterium]
MDRRKLTIHIAKDESVSAILTMPENKKSRYGVGVMTAHGAGNDMENELIAAFADGMAEAGYPALRFNFPYKEKKQKAPDSQKRLEETWAAVFRYFQEQVDFKVDHAIAAGKSMGGRVASQMVAGGSLPVEGLIFLGYPLHPAGDHSKIRDAHLYRVGIPMLFFAGTRDRLCDMTILQEVLRGLSAPWKLDIIESGDHSFHLPLSMKVKESETYGRIVDTAVKWIKTTFDK